MKVWFHSRSKKDDIVLDGDEHWRQYLSNFALVPGGLVWEGQTFAAPEHIFHYEKYKRSDKPALAKMFFDGSIPTAREAKSAGSKTGMKRRGAKLNVGDWNRDRVEVNRKIVETRMEQNEHFAGIVREAIQRGMQLWHFQRGSRRNVPFWGAYQPKESPGETIGKNVLGEQIMESLKQVT